MTSTFTCPDRLHLSIFWLGRQLFPTHLYHCCTSFSSLRRSVSYIWPLHWAQLCCKSASHNSPKGAHGHFPTLQYLGFNADSHMSREYCDAGKFAFWIAYFTTKFLSPFVSLRPCVNEVQTRSWVHWLSTWNCPSCLRDFEHEIGFPLHCEAHENNWILISVHFQTKVYQTSSSTCFPLGLSCVPLI